MSVVIRLKKTGTKKKIKHRIVVCDSRSPRDGKFIELLGTWDPNVQPAKLVLNLDKAKEWIAKGAQPSETMKSILKKAGLKK